MSTQNLMGLGMPAGLARHLANADATLPRQVYYAVSTAPTTNNLNLTGANITGAADEVYLNLTATLSAGATVTLPTVAALVAAMQTAGMFPELGMSFVLYIYNSSSGNYNWTTTTNTGWTLTATANTIAQNTMRPYLVTLVTISTATAQSLGEFTVTGAP